tara:strand:+ start:421 stop:1209 length:789 start_codon:yes stop_codon:yes gene_type:complete
MIDLKIRYYSNKDMVVLTALKVGSRFCDEHFGCTAVEPEVYITQFNDFIHRDKRELAHDKYNENYPKKAHLPKSYFFKPIYDILEGKEKRPVYLFMRDPMKRAVSMLNYFFGTTIHPKINRYMMLKKDSLLSDYDFIPNNEAKKIEGSEKLREMNQLAIKFCKYFVSEGFSDPHFGPYLFIYQYLLNESKSKNINIVDIDETRIEEIFGIEEINLYNSGGLKSNPYTKQSIRQAIDRSGLAGNLKSYLYTESFAYNELKKKV